MPRSAPTLSLMPDLSTNSSLRGDADALHDLPSGLVSLRTLEHEFESLRARADQLDSELNQWRRRVVDRSAPPSVRRTWVRTLVERFGLSERTACRLLDQHRSTQRYRSPDAYRTGTRSTVGEAAEVPRPRTVPQPRIGSGHLVPMPTAANAAQPQAAARNP